MSNKCSACPECGHKVFRNKNLVGDGYRECFKCGQDWWIDIDYSKPIERGEKMNQNEKTITDFLTNIANQNNRMTAAPYFYVIKSSSMACAPVENAEEVRYLDPENPDCTFETEDECRKMWSNDGYDEEEVEFVVERLEQYGVSKVWSEDGMFLTETDAEKHLKQNSYHYSKDAHTYVKHSWRAPELDAFFVALFNHFNVKKGNLDLRGIDN